MWYGIFLQSVAQTGSVNNNSGFGIPQGDIELYHTQKEDQVV